LDPLAIVLVLVPDLHLVFVTIFYLRCQVVVLHVIKEMRRNIFKGRGIAIPRSNESGISTNVEWMENGDLKL